MRHYQALFPWSSEENLGTRLGSYLAHSGISYYFVQNSRFIPDNGLSKVSGNDGSHE